MSAERETNVARVVLELIDGRGDFEELVNLVEVRASRDGSERLINLSGLVSRALGSNDIKLTHWNNMIELAERLESKRRHFEIRENAQFGGGGIPLTLATAAVFVAIVPVMREILFSPSSKLGDLMAEWVYWWSTVMMCLVLILIGAVLVRVFQGQRARKFADRWGRLERQLKLQLKYDRHNCCADRRDASTLQSLALLGITTGLAYRWLRRD
jgi:hypothetical protein